MLEACPIEDSDARVLGTNDYAADTVGSDIVVITAGLARKPGMSRDDLLNKNHAIIKSVTEQVMAHSPDYIIMPVTNPLDAMAQVAYRVSGLPRERVIGMAGVLDSARMRAFIAQALDVLVENTHAFVRGGHGDTMVPLPRYSTVAGIPITELMDGGDGRRDREADRARARRSSSSSGPEAPTTRLGRRSSRWWRRCSRTRRRFCRCSVFLKGEYGIQDLFVAVPCKLGANGLEEIVQIRLTPDEAGALKKSAAAVEELVNVINA